MQPDQVDRSDNAAVDLWQLAGLPGGLLEASYLTGPLASQYRLIVDVLLEQQQHTLTGVAATDLPGLLRERVVRSGADPVLLDDSSFVLPARMASLERWNVVIVFQDKAIRDADFVRDRDRYQLTEFAAELHRAVISLGHDVAAAAAATLAPAVLTANLDLLQQSIERDPTTAATAWSVIQTTYQAMARAAAGWQARLAGALAGPPDHDKIQRVQETLRRYVDMWGAGIDTHSEKITAAVAALTATPLPVWRRTAVHNLGASADDAAIDELATSYTQTLSTLRQWFDGPDCEARKLRRQMRDTIGPLLRGQRTLAAVGGHVSRRAEMLSLAAALDAAPSDEAAWALWCGATGLFSARHLPGEAPPPAGNPAASSWWDSDPVPVEARLRKQGPKATTGAAARIPDRSAGRRAARDRARREAEAQTATEAIVMSRSGLRLSEWPQISAAELGLLMQMLSTAGGVRPGMDGRRTAVTGDDRWQVTLDPPSPGALSAVLRITDGGRLVHPDVRLHLAPAGRRLA
ncbi:DUF2397 domain-containing protein [Dactylosporangium salmoneum]